MPIRRTESEWCELVAAWSESGKSAPVWCQENGVGYQSLLNWRKRFAEEPPALSVHSFCELVDETGLTAEVGGVRLRLQRGFDPVLLRDIVSALREA